MSRNIVRWYLMIYPASSKGLTVGLEKELSRRHAANEPLFEYFAPKIVQVQDVRGKLVKTEKPLLFNYFFLRASESEIYKIKKYHNEYNFLTRIKCSNGEEYYPYVSDKEIEAFKWVATSYEGVLPLFAADSHWLIQGDRIRITQGRFAGLEATVASRKRCKRSEVVVQLDNSVWVPLLQVHAGEYEVIELCDNGSRRYSRLDNEKVSLKLHQALCRKIASEVRVDVCEESKQDLIEADIALAKSVITEIANLDVDSNLLRCKQYAMLLMAYKIVDDKEAFEGLVGHIASVKVCAVKAELARALLLVTLYGCTNSSIYHNLAHEVVDPWLKEDAPKKGKFHLIQRLKDYDTFLGHNC